MALTKDLLEQALALPEDGRVKLAEALIESVDDPADEDAEPAWAAEARRRLKELRSGEVRAISWGEAEKRLFGPLD